MTILPLYEEVVGCANFAYPVITVNVLESSGLDFSDRIEQNFMFLRHMFHCKCMAMKTAVGAFMCRALAFVTPHHQFW
jgi:hypothetical protein